jgi:peptide/nickel transport system substrate-binding protein
VSFFRGVRLVLTASFLLAACRTAPTPPDGPTVTPAPSTVTPAAPNPTASAPAARTPTPAGPLELTICLAAEPSSLYRYARPEAGRDHILAALTDGPIVTTNYTHQPVLIDRLPSLAGGDIELRMVDVVPGDMVLDTLGRARPLAEGVTLRLADGGALTYSGTLPARLPQLVVTFHLRPGLRWSDGAPLTAADSVFAYEVARSPDSFDPMAEAALGTARYAATGDHTVIWTGLPGNLDPQAAANFWPPLPRHIFTDKSPVEIADSAEANRAPLSYGPFAMVEWVAGKRLVVERNPLYWRASEGLPRPDRVTYRFVAGASQAISELRTGGCDLVPSGMGLNAGDRPADGLVHYSAAGTTLLHLDFNLAPAADYAGAASTGLFQDAGLRQAFAYCLDRQTLGDGQPPPAAYLPRTHPQYAADAVEYPFNPAQGRQLLADRGWSDTNGDGVVDKDGQPLTLSLASGEAQAALMPAIQGQLRANCGIAVEPRLLTRGELEGDWPQGVIFGRRFDLAVFGWRIGLAPACELFTTGQIAAPENPSGANDTGYSSPEFDAACRPTVLADDQGAAQRIFARDLPMLPLFFQPQRAATRPGVQGYSLDPSAPSELWNIEEIQLTR